MIGVPFMELDSALNNVPSEYSSNASTENLNSNLEAVALGSRHDSVSSESGWNSDHESNPENVKRQKFNKARQEHYNNMKSVIQHGRELVDNEEQVEGYSDPQKFDNSLEKDVDMVQRQEIESSDDGMEISNNEFRNV